MYGSEARMTGLPMPITLDTRVSQAFFFFLRLIWIIAIELQLPFGFLLVNLCWVPACLGGCLWPEFFDLGELLGELLGDFVGRPRRRLVRPAPDPTRRTLRAAGVGPTMGGWLDPNRSVQGPE